MTPRQLDVILAVYKPRSEVTRTIAVAYFLQAKKQSQIARQLGVDIRNVNQIVRRLQWLVDCFDVYNRCAGE